MFGSKLYKTVDVGHVAVATLFGKLVDTHYSEGLHIPVNPLYKWHEFDVREKSHKEQAQVPSQDQLQTSIDVSVQYRLNGANVAAMLQTTGGMQQLLDVQLVPKLRSLLREQGKTIKRAEDFFLEETQDKLQTALLFGLQEYLEPKGVVVSAVLIRDITLPAFITKAIESKKEREQAVEKQKAELERYRTEQQQLVAQAEAQRSAAEELAAQKIILADAQAYEIKKINEAIGSNPNYIKLMSLEALKEISKDPASKIYFMDSNSPQPLPLMHLSDKE
jgi:regulator of protease activity HflC (stomatin/prohibitin superfamily)